MLQIRRFRVFLSILLISLSTTVYASESSEPYRYSLSLLDALHRCQRANFYIEEGRKVEGALMVLKNYHLAEGQFAYAESILDKYLKSEDKMLAMVALNVKLSIMGLRSTNQQFIKVISGEDVPNSEEEVIAAVAKLAALEHAGWIQLLEAVTMTFYILVEPADEGTNRPPETPIPFLITELERERLLAYINRLFADDIQIYRDSMKIAEQRSPDSEEITYDTIAFAVDYLDKTLRSRTFSEYEELVRR